MAIGDRDNYRMLDLIKSWSSFARPLSSTMGKRESRRIVIAGKSPFAFSAEEEEE
jgi:hypothetical protein